MSNNKKTLRLTEAEMKKIGTAYHKGLEDGVTLVKIGSREGERGNVHDTYELRVHGKMVMIIKHYVEFTLEEVPLNVRAIPNVIEFVR